MNQSSPFSAQTVLERDPSFRILVVDDNADVRTIEGAILQNEGHRVDMVESGEAAWEALVGGGYDLMVTDHRMPGISGLALVQKMRLAAMTLPVVMVSGNLDCFDMAKLADDPWSRVDAFLPKPFRVEDLVSVVHRILGRETPKAGSIHRTLD